MAAAGPGQGDGTSPERPRFFATAADLGMWLEGHHDRAEELWVGLYKKATGKPSVTWPELVDQLLRFGWIDGIRKSRDAESYVIRVTPRRKGSIWSAVNVRRARELIGAGLMAPAGLAAWEARNESKTQQYSFEREGASLGAGYEAEFRRDRIAWSFWEAQPPGYRRLAAWWVVSAKREETRRRRLGKLIEASAAGQRIAG